MAAVFRGGGQLTLVKGSSGDLQQEQKTEKAVHGVVFPLQ